MVRPWNSARSHSGGSLAPMEEPPTEISPTHLLFALIGLALMGMVGIFVFASTLIAPVWAGCRTGSDTEGKPNSSTGRPC